MSTEEFSNEFDTLLNSYSIFDINKQSPLELDEYEKSVFLTQAQEEIILELYNGKNSLGNSFEQTEELRRMLGSLVKSYITTEKQNGITGVSEFSQFFLLPKDLWFITYEQANLLEGVRKYTEYKNVAVVPVTQDSYNRIRENPFKRNTKKRVLRLDTGNNLIELISKYNIEQYSIFYISKPSPIILDSLPDSLSLNGIKEKTECKLNPVLHRAILDRAVRLAISTKSINTGK